MFLKFFGKDRDPATLSQRDWDPFIRDRRSGRVGPSGKPVSDRTIERDLRFLLAVLNWAAKPRDEQGQLLLESNPLRGLKTPTEKNPTRVLLTEPEYEALLEVSLEMDWRFRVALVIAHETGHRIGAIRQLRWSDIDLEGCIIRWRGEHKKTRYEHRTPVSAEALAALEEARRKNPGIGDAPLLPAPKDPSKCVSRSLARDWWEKAQDHAGTSWGADKSLLLAHPPGSTALQDQRKLAHTALPSALTRSRPDRHAAYRPLTILPLEKTAPRLPYSLLAQSL